ncbi:MAG: hypothetical protein WAW61_15715 [Methylococcaceae bacterium]
MICRDLKRNEGKKGYYPKQAQIKAVKFRKKSRKDDENDGSLDFSE